MKSAIILAALFSGSAFAVGIGNDNPGGGGTQTQNVSSYTNQYSQTSSNAKATGVGLGVGVGLGGNGGAGGIGGSAVGNGGAGGMGGSATGGVATSRSAGGAGGVASSMSGGGQGGNANAAGGQGGNPNAAGGTSSVVYNEAPAAAQRGTVTIKNTPEVTLSNIAPTSPCMGGTSAGGSGPGFSIGIGTTWKDSDCSLRETARSFAGLGLTDDAIAILCSSEYAAAAPSCKALKKD